ncbi:MAG TPA: hypothetical protein VFS08_14030 [Gemmatimonadaceae bacterium]|nr:hypothetical protein [Gemmatimonadaceae bacterium]
MTNTDRLARGARGSAPSRFMARVTPERRRLHWVANYFQLSAGLGALSLAGGLVAAALDVAGSRATLLGHPVAWSLAVATVAGWWYTGHLLHARRREGGWMALLNLVPPLAGWALAGNGGVSATLVLSAAGLVAVLTAWRDLH